MAYDNKYDWQDVPTTPKDKYDWQDVPAGEEKEWAAQPSRAPESDYGGLATRKPEYDWKDTLATKENGYEEASVLDRVGDIGVDIGKGVVGFGESFVGLAKMEPTGLVRKGFDAIGYDAAQTDQFLTDLYSDERKHEEGEVEDATGVMGTIKTLIKNPAAMAGQAIQMAPGMLSIISVAKVALARASASAIAAATAKGITNPKVLANIGRRAGSKAATLTAAAAEGVQQTGSSFNRLVDDAESIGKAYTASILSGVGTAALAFVGGKVGQKLGLGDVEAGLAAEGGFAGRVAKAVGSKLGLADSKIAGRGAKAVGSGLQEGLLEETGQGMQEQAWQNYATGRPLLEGVPEAGATGFVLGGVTGGGMTMLSKSPKSPTDEVDLLNTGMVTREEQQREEFMDKLLNNMESGEMTPERMQWTRDVTPEGPLRDILDGFLIQPQPPGPYAGEELVPVADAPQAAETIQLTDPAVIPHGYGEEGPQGLLPPGQGFEMVEEETGLPQEILPEEQIAEDEWVDIPVEDPAVLPEKTDVALEGEAVATPEAGGSNPEFIKLIEIEKGLEAEAWKIHEQAQDEFEAGNREVGERLLDKYDGFRAKIKANKAKIDKLLPQGEAVATPEATGLIEPETLPVTPEPEEVAEMTPQGEAVVEETPIDKKTKRITNDEIFDELDFGENQVFVDKLLNEGKSKNEILESAFSKEALDNRPELRRAFARNKIDQGIQTETDPLRKYAMLLNPENSDAAFGDLQKGRTRSDQAVKDIIEGKQPNSNDYSSLLESLGENEELEAKEYIKSLHDELVKSAAETRQPDVAEDRRIQDRRRNEINRKRVDEMTFEEAKTALKTNNVTGLPNKRAYDESDKKPRAGFFDIDVFKDINDEYGHDVGDIALRNMADAMRATGEEIYNLSGDEYAIQAETDKELDKAAKIMYDYLENNPVEIEVPGQPPIKIKVGFSYGKGKTLPEADKALKRHKGERKLLGLRHDRERDTAPRLSEEMPEGNEDFGEREGSRSTVAPEEQPLKRKPSNTLKDGIEVELKPLDKVEVLKKDLSKPSEPTESIKPETLPTTPETEKSAEPTTQAKPTAPKKQYSAKVISKKLPSSDLGDRSAISLKKSPNRLFVTPENFSNITKSSTFLNHLDDLINIPKDIGVTRDTPDAVDGKTAPAQSLLDSVRSGTKALRDILNSQTFRNEGFSGLDIKTQRLVTSHMLRLSRNKQVFDSIIEFIPVDVMDNLRSLKLSPKMLFKNAAMLKKALSVDLSLKIPLLKATDTFKKPIALSGAKNKAAFALDNLVSVTNDRLSAKTAGSGNSFSLIKSIALAGAKESSSLAVSDSIRIFNDRLSALGTKSIHVDDTTRQDRRSQEEKTKNFLKDSNVSFEELQELFKHQKVSQLPDGSVSVKTALGKSLVIKFVETITPDKAAFHVGYGRAKNSGELIAGKYKDGIVTISKVGDIWTVAHEGHGHWAEEMGFTNKNDQKALSFEIKRRVKAGKWETLNKDDIGSKEDRAEFIAQELKKRSGSRPTVQRVIQKIQDLIDAFVNLYKRTARGVIREVESGKIYNKESEEATKKHEQYSVKTVKDDAYVKAFLEKHGIEVPKESQEGIKKTSVINENPSSPEGFNMPTEGRGRQVFDLLQFKIQDRLNSLRKVEATIEKQKGIEIPDDSTAYQTEELYHGKVSRRVGEFDTEHIDPLVESITNSGYDLEDVEEFMYARHAPEANARLEAINPKRKNNKALSGMSNEESGKVMAKYSKDTGMIAIANQIDAITKKTRRILVDEGLATSEEVGAWENLYKHYIPLKREEKASGMPKRGAGMNIGGRESNRRLTGSLDKKASNILANIVAQHEATIIRAEKAKVGRAMLKLAEAHPNKELWEVDAAELKPFLKQRKDAGADETTGLPSTLSEVVYGKDILYKFNDNVLVVKVEGKEHTITFNDQNVHAQRIVKSLKNLGADNSGAIMNTLSKVNRFLAIVNTSANPEFIISNFARDIQTAGYNINDTEAKNVKIKIFKDVFKALQGIRRGVREDYSTEWAKNYKDFAKAGAQTGWTDHYKDIEDREKNLKQKLNLAKGGGWNTAKKAMKGVIDFVGDENTAVENAIRLSTYTHLREIGMSKAKAASAAKNLTVNFNRRGDMGQALNAMYLFFNASAQGSARLIYAAARSPKVRKLMYGTVGVAVMLDIMNRAIGGDDDDGEKKYDKVPSWVKEHNLIVMRPNGDYFKLPLPWGYNVLHVLGQGIGEAVDPNHEGFDALGTAFKVGSAVLGSFNPMGSESTLLQLVSPTISDPFVQWAENKNFAGIPIKPEQLPFDVPKPEYQMHWKNTGEVSKWAAKQLNDLTGGDEVVPGKVNVSPEVFELFAETIAGGAGRFLDNTVALPKTLKKKDVDVRRVPFARRLYGEAPDYYLRTKFYDNLNEIRYAEKSIKHYRGDKAVRKKYAGELKFSGRAKQNRKVIKTLRDRRKAVEKNQTLDEAVKERKVEDIEKRVAEVMARFNRAYKGKDRLNEYVMEYINIRKSGKSLAELKKSVIEFNRKQAETGGRTIPWSSIVKKGNRSRKAKT